MQEHMAVKVKELAGERIACNVDVSEHIDPSPDSYVTLRYEEHKNPEYIRIIAINRHPTNAIDACFYTLHESGICFISDKFKGRTIKARLKPSESTVIHFAEKRRNSRLFLFNAAFVDGE